MAGAYFLISAAPRMDENVKKELRKEKGITEVHGLYGEYDFIVKADSPSLENLGECKRKLRNIPGVLDVYVIPFAMA